MTLLIVTAVDAEARAVGTPAGCVVVVGGIGRTNAAATVTQSVLRHGPFLAVISAGIAGALPGSGLEIGDAVIASSCVYAEEGLVTADGWAGMETLGFALGDFTGNTVPVDVALLAALDAKFRSGPIATVATCSGTDAAAAEVARRTGAIAEAMEGAAVVHAARRLGVPAIELCTISNTTGHRDSQRWDLPRALAALDAAAAEAVDILRDRR